MHPKDQLFATLDVTAHGGTLFNRMPVIYIDTVGFISALPHNLVASFAATLEDVLLSVSTRVNGITKKMEWSIFSTENNPKYSNTDLW